MYLIFDQASYHRAERVLRAVRELKITFVYFADSPNLNPTECLWKVINEKVRNNQFFKSAKDFRRGINRFFFREFT